MDTDLHRDRSDPGSLFVCVRVIDMDIVQVLYDTMAPLYGLQLVTVSNIDFF